MPTPAFTQITPHIFKLDLPFAGGRIPVGVWLIREESGWVVVDAGAPGFEDVVFKQILTRTGGEIPRRLILTHGHLNHAAAAQRMETYLDNHDARLLARVLPAHIGAESFFEQTGAV